MRFARFRSTAIIIFLFTFGFALSAVADQWTQLTPLSSPPPRSTHAMADLGGGQVLFFALPEGASFAPVSPTWVYDSDAGNWTNITSVSAPAARMYHAMAYLGSDKALLFGGSEPAGGWPIATWVYDASDNNWTLMEPDSYPAARRGCAMAYIGEDKVLLFGGFTSDYSVNGETWVYDLSDDYWTHISPLGSPSARRNPAMAYLGGDQVILFGGVVASGSVSNETWVYDLSANTWTSMNPSEYPPARQGHSVASLGDDQVLLFGGSAPPNYLGDTWVYDLSDNSWIERTFSTAPSSRIGSAMAAIGTGQVLLFGGAAGGPTYGDTWLYEAGSTTQADVDIDIKFCGNPNSFNCKQKGVLSVTIFGSADIDVFAIDVSSLKLCLATDPEDCVTAVDAEFPGDRGNPISDLGTAQCIGEIANPDSMNDLDVHFISREVATLINCSSLGKKGVSPALILKGQLNDGTPFISTAVNDVGVDQLWITKK